MRPVTSLPLSIRTLLPSGLDAAALQRTQPHAIHSNHASWAIRSSHNLTNRYKVLETDIRPIEIRAQVANGMIYNASSAAQPENELSSADIEMETMNRGGSKSILRPKPRMFHGILIPVKPPPPESDGLFVISVLGKYTYVSLSDCCMSSCTVCVYDLYATALEEYEDGITEAREGLVSKNVPLKDWPIELLTGKDRETRLEKERARLSEGSLDLGRRLGVTGESEKEKQMAVIIGAFVQLEQSLREKKRKEQLDATS